MTSPTHPSASARIANSHIPEIRQQDVIIQHGADTLAGTLYLPQLGQRCPAVALVHGSGDDTREGYRVFAQHFAERGIASLIYDKRGVGASTGSWRSGTFAELANDALVGVRLLAQRDEVDPHRVGLWGCSEGGWVIPLAAGGREVAFLVAISAAGVSPAQQEIYRRTLLVEAKDSRMGRAMGRARLRSMFGLLRTLPSGALPGVAGYFARTMDFDPAPIWRQVTQPVLLVYGAADAAVPPQQSADIIARALQAAGNERNTILVFPDADHGIQTLNPATQERAFAPGYLDAVADWILAR
ncbi:MAG TPA: prolyl oligopeptidase family serine peptidase [Ktedonobacterales bacterium]|jgi:dipeptidyl aminopeptidase/acylaminoacyl peptidase|nr:prolyl oligopeptidase family serine peptidase [Ktedonobacterales bacterium]